MSNPIYNKTNTLTEEQTLILKQLPTTTFFEWCRDVLQVDVTDPLSENYDADLIHTYLTNSSSAWWMWVERQKQLRNLDTLKDMLIGPKAALYQGNYSYSGSLLGSLKPIPSVWIYAFNSGEAYYADAANQPQEKFEADYWSVKQNKLLKVPGRLLNVSHSGADLNMKKQKDTMSATPVLANKHAALVAGAFRNSIRESVFEMPPGIERDRGQRLLGDIDIDLKKFLTTGAHGTTLAMGRVTQYLAKEGQHPSWPPSTVEARDAIIAVGCDLTRSPVAGDIDYRPYHLSLEGQLAEEISDEDRISLNSYASTGAPTFVSWMDLGSDLRTAIDKQALMNKAQLEALFKSVPGYSAVAHLPPYLWDDDLRWLMINEIRNFISEHKWAGGNHAERQWWTVTGRVKKDDYSMPKLHDFALRLYNVFPRQVSMLMAVGTQPFEFHTKAMTFLDSPPDDPSLFHQMLGIRLCYDGADKVVYQLDRALDQPVERASQESAPNGLAWVLLGDDSWVVVRAWAPEGEVPAMAMFSADCSSFDLTQHNDVTRFVHQFLAEQISKFSPMAAGVWYAYARERPTVLVSTLAYMMRNCGPSGLRLQSQVNSAVMAIFLRRVVNRIGHVDDDHRERGVPMATHELESLIRTTVSDVGVELMLEPRVDDLVTGHYWNLRSMLVDHSFLFLGYLWRAREFDELDASVRSELVKIGGPERPLVQLTADLPRQIRKMRFFAGPWVKPPTLFHYVVMVSLSGVVLNMGAPPAGLEAAWAVLFSQVLDGVAYASQKVLEASTHSAELAAKLKRLENLVGVLITGPELPQDLAGIEKALRRDWQYLWSGLPEKSQDAMDASAAPPVDLTVFPEEWLKGLPPGAWDDMNEKAEAAIAAQPGAKVPPKNVSFGEMAASAANLTKTLKARAKRQAAYPVPAKASAPKNAGRSPPAAPERPQKPRKKSTRRQATVDDIAIPVPRGSSRSGGSGRAAASAVAYDEHMLDDEMQSRIEHEDHAYEEALNRAYDEAYESEAHEYDLMGWRSLD